MVNFIFAPTVALAERYAHEVQGFLPGQYRCATKAEQVLAGAPGDDVTLVVVPKHRMTAPQMQRRRELLKALQRELWGYSVDYLP